METIVAGSRAPNIILKNADSTLFELNSLETQCKYVLILFWSAGCSHCVETINTLYPWYQQTDVQQKVRIVAISLDETEAEVEAWKKKIAEMNGWKNLRAPEGIRSKVAGDYYVLATPVMVLLNAKTKEVVALPNTLKELIKGMQ